jgi:hypothetical protein
MGKCKMGIDKPSLTLPALKKFFLSVLGGKNAFRLLRTFTAKKYPTLNLLSLAKGQIFSVLSLLK